MPSLCSQYLQMQTTKCNHITKPSIFHPDPRIERIERRLDRYDTIGAPSARKLSALALCVLLTLPLPALLERLDVILPHVTGTWLEVCKPCHGLPLALPVLDRPLRRMQRLQLMHC